MPVVVSCECGKRLQAGEKLAGKRVKCPACGRTLEIPATPQPASEDLTAGVADFGSADLFADLPVPNTAAPLPATRYVSAAPQKPAISGAQAAAQKKLVLMIAGAAGGLVVAVLLVVLAVWGTGKLRAVIAENAGAAADNSPPKSTASGDRLAQLTPGMPAGEVLEIMGQPTEVGASAYIKEIESGIPFSVSKPPGFENTEPAGSGILWFYKQKDGTFNLLHLKDDKLVDAESHTPLMRPLEQTGKRQYSLTCGKCGKTSQITITWKTKNARCPECRHSNWVE